MAIIIIAVILAIAVFVGLGFRVKDYEVSWKLGKRQALAVLPLLLILFTLVTVIPANTVGIVWSPFNGVQEETLAEGIQFKGPLDKVYKISTEVQTSTLTDVSGQTADSQYITMNLDVKYRVNTESAFEVFRQYRTLENVANSLIAPTVQRSIEAVTTQYNVIEILGEQRNAVYAGVEAELANRLVASGITFQSINFNDTDAGEAIEKAISDEAVAKKEVDTAQYKLQTAQIEAQHEVVQAEAEKQRAEIEAEIKRIEAQAEADANKIISESIDQTILDRMWIEKWDGDVPAVTGGTGSGYILDIGGGVS